MLSVCFRINESWNNDNIDSLKILESHVLQKGGMSQHKAAPFFLVNLPIMFGICFFKGLEK